MNKLQILKMASIRFAGLVFGVIIISLALKYSFACAQEAGSGATRKNRWLTGIEYQTRMLKDFRNDVSEAEVVANIAGRKVQKGRKMEVINRLSNQLDKKSKLLAEDHVSDKTSKTACQDSSMEAKVSTESVNHHLHQDKHTTSSSSSSSSSKSYSEAAAYELMLQNHGDYTHTNAPHKKPPVNNDKPRN